MATTWGKPSLSMVARAAFLRSRKNAACSSGLSRICCRRLVAISLSLLSRNRQMCRQEALGLVEALLRRTLGVARVGTDGEAVAGAVVVRKRAHLAEIPPSRPPPTPVRDRRLPVLPPGEDQGGDGHALGEIGGLGAALSARRPEGEAVEDDDHADLRVRSSRHERVHPAAAEAEDG